ncbi:MAG: MinD/ParA family protein [Oscillatoria sp. SIO1A7]|nr:MinD/ParA family protein [Oscillatoria sp. SIO1A7]
MAKIVAVHSFRGGTGKSNLVANLATSIALQGQRVGIVDTDIQSPGIHVLFGLDETQIDYTLNDYLWGNCPVQETAYDVSSVLQQELPEEAAIGKIYLIPSRLQAGEIVTVLSEGYDVDILNTGFRDLIASLNLDYLFIDTHPGLNEETLLSIGISDVLVIILRPDYQDYQGTAVTVEVAEELEVPEMFMVVNKVLSDVDMDALKQQVGKTYQMPVAAVLPLCDEMVRLASRSIFCLRYPEHTFTKKLYKIADQI